MGRITPGALADIAIVNMESLNTVPVRDPIKNLVNHLNLRDISVVVLFREGEDSENHKLSNNKRHFVKMAKKVTED